MKNPLTRSLLPGRWGRPLFYLVAAAIILPMAWRAYQQQLPHNGFDLGNSAVPASEIVGGGPGRDGIPALTNPRMLTADQAPYSDDQRVLAIARDGAARAYPIHILNWHEVVNDSLAGQPILVSWCPLCNTGIVYRRPVTEEQSPLEFGVSGLLHQDNLLMYDRRTQSLWSQLSGEAISGDYRGQRLAPLTAAHTRWGDWRRRYPHTRVMAPDTGYQRDYGKDPYADYHRQPVGERQNGQPAPYEPVVGLSVNGQARAYPLAALAERGPRGQLRDRLAGRDFTLHYDATNSSFHLAGKDTRGLKSTLAYWFAWKSFHPRTSVWGLKEQAGSARD